MKNTGIIILAAGESSRLGRPKQLLTFRDTSLLQKVIDQCAPLEFDTGVIVLGAHADDIRKAVDPGKFTFVMNPEWKEGIASSIRKGVEFSLELNPETEHLLFLLSDQPFVTTALLQRLLKTHKTGKKEITASLYDEDVGVPAVYSKPAFPLLKKLSGDKGAKKVMKRFPEKVATVPFGKGSFDVDTPEDYEALRQFES